MANVTLKHTGEGEACICVDSKEGENGGFLLKHGVGHKPIGSEIDVPLDYGDYYFLEALLRFKR